MWNDIDERAVEIAEYAIATGKTVRAIAEKFGVSKSTVHKDITRVLFKVNKPLYAEVRKVLELNKQERHIRGGEATKKKYEMSM